MADERLPLIAINGSRVSPGFCPLISTRETQELWTQHWDEGDAQKVPPAQTPATPWPQLGPPPWATSTSVPKRDGLLEALDNRITGITAGGGTNSEEPHVQQLKRRWGEASPRQSQRTEVTGWHLVGSVSGDIAKTPENPRSGSTWHWDRPGKEEAHGTSWTSSRVKK